MINKRIIKIKETDKDFSTYGGIYLYEVLSRRLLLESKLHGILPKNKIEPGTSSYEKFKALCLGFIAGADSLDDMYKLSTDPGFFETLGYVNAANTYGEYLRSFSTLEIKKLNEKLIETALELRSKSHKRDKDFILDVDSTPCVQHGIKMEGLAYNYKSLWCLDSIQAYDQYGFEYSMDIRPGSTYSSDGAETIIHNVFKRVPEKLKRYFRGDSAFAKNEVFKALDAKSVKFAIAMRENVYNSFIWRIDNWKNSKLKFHDRRETEIGHWFYTPGGSGRVYRIIALRALKKDRQRSLLNPYNYDYFVCISNIGSHEMRDEKIIKFYRKRGQAENYIKELKYGFDAKHWPCQKLNANKVYGIISAFAYNLMRYTAFKLNKKKTHYSKMIRYRMVRLGCQVVRHARYAYFKFNSQTAKEVNCWLNEIQKEFSYGFS
ncbi:IS1380 family transposase [Candidatus Woesearchaeota archaeon]|nr:MAG: IS1380 family transposase [Candidatus Woesearchaeota archaeon]